MTAMSALFLRPRLVLPFAATLALASPGLHAQETVSEISVDEVGVMTDPGADTRSVKYGSFGIGSGLGGIGVDWAYPLHRFFDIRLGYDFGKFGFDFEEDAEEEGAEPIEYKADLKFSSARLLIDYKPFGGGFRISAGYYTGTPELEARSQGLLEEVELGDGTYTIDGLVRADADLGSGAPYLGIGWGGTTSGTGFGMSFDVGVLFADAPKFAVEPSGRACDASINPECDPVTDPTSFAIDRDSADPQSMAFFEEVDNEVAELEDDSKDFDMWPILRFGLHYRF